MKRFNWIPVIYFLLITAMQGQSAVSLGNILENPVGNLQPKPIEINKVTVKPVVTKAKTEPEKHETVTVKPLHPQRVTTKPPVPSTTSAAKSANSPVSGFCLQPQIAAIIKLFIPIVTEIVPECSEQENSQSPIKSPLTSVNDAVSKIVPRAKRDLASSIASFINNIIQGIMKFLQNILPIGKNPAPTPGVPSVPKIKREIGQEIGDTVEALVPKALDALLRMIK
ncbi:uncharacterized protein [Prorops nasuta]|uniref:uncharacterized protein isoform X2 n=1 Tax=Prorops nasuta TaxID=863751 RepID=UPI0034CF6FFB